VQGQEHASGVPDGVDLPVAGLLLLLVYRGCLRQRPLQANQQEGDRALRSMEADAKLGQARLNVSGKRGQPLTVLAVYGT
jgi:hypothetical protein